MMSLELPTPQESHLEQNAQPKLQGIADAISELQMACAAFSPCNDNRGAIVSCAEKIQTLTQELSEVTGEDSVLLAASREIHELRMRLAGHFTSLKNWIPRLSSEEEGTRLPLKKLSRASNELRVQVREFGDTKDNRGAMARSLEEIKARAIDVATVDENVDPWIVNNITAACDAFLRLLKEPIRTEPAITPTFTKERVPLRGKLSDELDELIHRLSGIGNRLHGGMDEAKPLVARVRAMRQEMFDKAYEAIDQPEVYAVQLRDLRSDLQALNDLRSDATKEPGFMQQYTRYPIAQIDTILKLLEPASVEVDEAKKSFLSTTIGRAFAWAQ